ncbi:MAG: ATP-dependent Clp protease adaptor ClpS [Defluviitaleaceae bacterium]|nr:ATP-dependent Clp protease adaptor ClpS [Defluviitaleaceae bacterium]MCL2835140.1 ATP-dependent Clp protease adaptor ClpS [Defluviitaleaceae bacterium]
MPGETRRIEERGNAFMPELREPNLYAVVLHNDDYTTMDFVVAVLMRVFQKQAEEAARIMTDVHINGEGVAGVYPFDIAVTKRLLAERMAEEKNFPLRVSVMEATGR